MEQGRTKQRSPNNRFCPPEVVDRSLALDLTPSNPEDRTRSQVGSELICSFHAIYSYTTLIMIG